MKIKDILESLEEIENNEDKLKYLKEILKRIDDKILIKEINELIEELENDLEEKLQDVVITPQRKRIIEIDDAEHDIEIKESQVTRQRIARPDINLSDLDNEKEVRYESINLNYKPINITPIYQSAQPFSSYENIALQNQLNTKLVEEILVKEKDFNIGQVINDVQREEIRDTIDKFIPNASAEEKIRAEQQVVYDMKFKNKDLKYITKLR